MKKLILFTFLALFSLTTFAQNRSYWQQEVDYTMEIDVDAENHQYAGEQTLVYTNNSPDVLDRVYYHLYFNAFQPGSMMDVRSRTIADPDGRVLDRIYHLDENEIGYQKVTSLTQDGEPVNYETDGTILVVELDEPIQPGATTTFRMEWDAQVPLQVRRSGRDNSEGVEFSMSQWYPKLAEYDHQGWHPNEYVAREFHAPFGNFDVKISIDRDYVLGGTGILQNPNQIGYGYEDEGATVNRPSGDKLTWHFKAENVIDFFWGADPDFKHVTAQVPNGPKLHFLYQQPAVVEGASEEQNAQYTENWEELVGYTIDAFKYANEHFGEYPYPQYTNLQGGDGGMEYPMGTLITGGRSLGSLVGVMVHEMYHSWYQNVIATNESLYAWMDEGFTSFASSETMAHLFDREGNPHRGSLQNYRYIAKSDLEEPLSTHADHYNTNGAYSVAAYSKGAVFLNQIRYIIGEEDFREGMLRYHNEWKFKHPTDLDFISIMEKESGMILDWFYEYFVQTTKTIDYSINSVLGNENKTIFKLERIGLMPMPLDILVEYNDGSSEMFYIPLRMMRGEKPAESDMKRTVLQDWPWVQPEYNLTVNKPASQIKTITIDPSGRLADINPENNSFDVASMLND
ncbi:MAG TPA: M1 family metallopeptidase [Gracilimonas sp.]|uniref:M1 family metallopeptidase n=1 Tax=Gracilimonas sp. TaxID=1974203 RepID=UPI002DA502B6|nr:M1 family metallopeptidase [Gracilimonas sp.]